MLWQVLFVRFSSHLRRNQSLPVRNCYANYCGVLDSIKLKIFRKYFLPLASINQVLLGKFSRCVCITCSYDWIKLLA